MKINKILFTDGANTKSNHQSVSYNCLNLSKIGEVYLKGKQIAVEQDSLPTRGVRR